MKQRFTAVSTLALLCSPALAQKPLHFFEGDADVDHFGISSAGVGDLDADGFDDVVVGAPQHIFPVNGPGYARAYSGADGSLLYDWTGVTVFDRFGTAVAAAGDVNDDGHDDVMVGAPQDGNGNGYVRVFSGLDGSVLLHLTGDELGGAFGSALATAGDLDGDDCADLLVGEPNAPTPVGAFGGILHVISGKTGATLSQQVGADVHNFGLHVSTAGDLNGDGIPEYMGASSGGPHNPHVRIF